MARGQRFRNNAKREFNRYWRNKQKQKAMRTREITQGEPEKPIDYERLDKNIVSAIWAVILFLIFAILGTTK